MASIQVQILNEKEIKAIHDATVVILGETGIMVHHEKVLGLLGLAGAKVDENNKIARLPENLIMESIERAGKKYILHGRDNHKTARFGYGDFIQMSSPGQFGWIDEDTGQMRPATMNDAHNAIRLGDALDNIKIVGSMAQPQEIPESYREVALTGELAKYTTKPTRSWLYNGKTAKYVLEIYKALAGGEQALRQKPMIDTFLEPISPLQLPKDGLDIVIEFVNAGQPVSIGPMAMTGGTAPATLAGTLALENAEILAGVVITQLLRQGTAVTYGGIPHMMDPKTGICSFGSPEQALMGVAMTQIAHFYGFPVYINVGLTDAKLLDLQAGVEKANSLLLGALAGADMFGHCGICGTDHAGSLSWLVADDELMNYVKRIFRGFDVNPETLATEVIKAVGPAGNFLSETHTLNYFRKELWLPSTMWTRKTYDEWRDGGRRSFADRAGRKVKQILDIHESEPLEDNLTGEIDKIVDSAKRNLT